MNTFQATAALAPLPRYDARFARAVGKYILNAANTSRLFYANGLPPENQTCYDQRSSTRNVVAYEGLRKTGFRPQDRNKCPCAVEIPWPAAGDFPCPRISRSMVRVTWAFWPRFCNGQATNGF